MTSVNVYFDMDGVLADFDKYVHDKTNVQNSLKGSDNREGKQFIENELSLGRKMFQMFEPIESNITLLKDVHFAFPYVNVAVLTSVGLRDMKHWMHEIMRQKTIWARLHLPREVPLIFVPNSHRKADYAHGPEDVLIDDRRCSLDPWEDKGGTGLEYLSDDETPIKDDLMVLMDVFKPRVHHHYLGDIYV